DEPGTPQNLAVLSHRFWTSRFGDDRNIVGRKLTLNGQDYTVIGVAPSGDPWLNQADLFLTLTHRPDADRGSFELSVIGRLRSGVSMAAAAADLDGIARGLAERFPQVDRGIGFAMQPSATWGASPIVRRSLWVLMGAVGFLLLIACVNLANLFLARAAGGARERAGRAALGGSRGGIVVQVLNESLLVSALGAARGLGLALGILQLVRRLDPGGIPRLAEIGINGWVLG